MTVGIIGLGKIGTALGENFADAGHDVVGYDLDAAARRDAEAAGVRVADDAAGVAREAGTVLLSLPHPDASRAVIDEIAASGATPAVFDTSTISPVTARELAERAAEAGVDYFGCPITGGMGGAEAGELVALLGGDADRIREHAEVLSTIAEAAYHIGEVGDAQLVKLVHNHVGQTVLVIFVEGLFLCDAWGVDPAVLHRVLRHYTAIYDHKLDAFFGNAFAEEFAEHFTQDPGDVAGTEHQFGLGAAHKDLVELREVADETDTYLPLGSFVEQWHRFGVKAGYGDRPHYDMLRLFEDVFDADIETRAETREKSEGRIV